MKRAALFALLTAAALCQAGAGDAWAKQAKSQGQPSQGGGVNLSAGKSGQPLEIYADQGMELSQDLKKVIARGNAKAIRGNVTVTADTLIAHYRDKSEAPAAPAKPAGKDGGKDNGQGGGSEIWKVEAVDHVTIASPTQTVYGDHADYNIDDAMVKVTGQDLRLVTPTDRITARDSLEYWDQKQQAVARGKAMATRGDKTIHADILTADFAKGEDGKMAISKAHADKEVVLVTPQEEVHGDHADYDVVSGLVVITGNVRLIREQNSLDGQYATVNLNTGISKLYPVAPGGGGGQQRVKGVFMPQQKDGASTLSPMGGQR